MHFVLYAAGSLLVVLGGLLSLDYGALTALHVNVVLSGLGVVLAGRLFHYLAQIRDAVREG